MILVIRRRQQLTYLLGGINVTFPTPHIVHQRSSREVTHNWTNFELLSTRSPGSHYKLMFPAIVIVSILKLCLKLKFEITAIYTTNTGLVQWLVTIRLHGIIRGNVSQNFLCHMLLTGKSELRHWYLEWCGRAFQTCIYNNMNECHYLPDRNRGYYAIF